MENPISLQLAQAASALALGLAAGFFYDLLRAFRRRFKGGIVTALSDLVFWLAVGSALFVFGLTLGGGQPRLFVLVLAFIGGWVYFAAVSPFALYLWESVLEVVKFLILSIVFPFVAATRMIKKLVLFLKKLFSFWRKRCTINSQVLRLSTRFGEEVKDYEAQEGGTDNENSGSDSGGIRRRQALRRSRSDRGGKGNSQGADRAGSDTGDRKRRHALRAGKQRRGQRKGSDSAG
jgi:hypothetical protein